MVLPCYKVPIKNVIQMLTCHEMFSTVDTFSAITLHMFAL